MSTSLPTTFYQREGNGYLPTLHTRGPWSPDHQHGGPPAALLGQAIEAAFGPEFAPVRLTFELPRPVPIAPMSLVIATPTGGRRARRVEGRIEVAGKVVMHATATAIVHAEISLPSMPPRPARSEEPENLVPETFPFFTEEVGYHQAMDLRFARGGFGQGFATAWMRPKLALVEGEAWSPLGRVLVAADSGNGVSNALPAHEYLFINPDLTVTLHRFPRGEWVCLDATTIAEPSGRGLAHSRLFDEAGALGHAIQTLLVASRR